MQENSFILDWCKWIPAKVNIHVWRMEMDRVPTAKALKKRNVDVSDTSCPLCHSEDESADHIFGACFVASTVWNAISSWCKIPNIIVFSLKDLLTTNLHLKDSDKKKAAVHGIIFIACWSLWRARNNIRFLNSPVRIEGIVSEIKALGFL
ncbi:uncharacterized protein LOC110945053 [Helianthus annuus]|uniref:uncharacterized protein LOC110945053 n=1 Tax=Helianthus annuus TaxID=4232 RepID=UPI000B8F8FB8|nr:uncharacterized protein LOC110945053 [Helianthus annuus]